MIVTDIDSVDANSEKCPVNAGVTTSNISLRDWLPGKHAIADLMATLPAEKAQGVVRVAYQTTENGRCGRSFEEAFVYANLQWLSDNHQKLVATAAPIKKASDKGLATEAWALSGKLSKVDFALDLMTNSGWATPQYIQEGLVWLANQRANA